MPVVKFRTYYLTASGNIVVRGRVWRKKLCSLFDTHPVAAQRGPRDGLFLAYGTSRSLKKKKKKREEKYLGPAMVVYLRVAKRRVIGDARTHVAVGRDGAEVIGRSAETSTREACGGSGVIPLARDAGPGEG